MSLLPPSPSRARSRSVRSTLGALGSAAGLVVGFVVLAPGATGLMSGCSSATTTPGGTTPGGCDPKQCAPGNDCIELGGETKCRKTCTSNTDATKACPFGYSCNAVKPIDTACTGSQCYCAELAVKLTKKDKGQWGWPCNPAGRIEGNPDCDSAQQFTCFATNPVDASAYCTRACAKDTECGAGFFCATVNDTPNAETTRRDTRNTIKICQKRTYCSPCATPVDCPDGSACIGDDKGVRFCAPTCETDTNCNGEAFCADARPGGGKVCYPRAGACIGDGGFCSPCRADSDCKDGACARNEYTTERFCTVTSPSKCKSRDCPAAPEGVAAVGCVSANSDDIPGGSCVGLFKLGSSQLPGCYTAPRK